MAPITFSYNTGLLLRGNGVDGATALSDDTGKTVSFLGNAQVSTARSMFSQTSSLKFDGAGDYLTVPYGSDFVFDGDFTVEAWVNLSVLPADGKYFCIASQSWALPVANNSWFLGINKDATLGLRAHFSMYAEPAAGGHSLYTSWSGGAINQWVHIAGVRNNNAINVFVNGVPGTWTPSIKLNLTSAPIHVGAAGIAAADPWYMNGYISELRITRGAALYRDSFTPPAEPMAIVSGSREIAPASPGNKWMRHFFLGDAGQYLAMPKAGNATMPLKIGNRFFAGPGRVAGTVKYAPDIPVYRIVHLLREDTFAHVRTQWSNAVTGAYSFDYVDTSCTYTVISYDHLGTYRAVVADRVVPEVIP